MLVCECVCGVCVLVCKNNVLVSVGISTEPVSNVLMWNASDAGKVSKQNIRHTL